jgi:hypothetical protein
MPDDRAIITNVRPMAQQVIRGPYMTIDDIIRTLKRVEAAHPDTTPALAPIRALLSGNQFAWIDPDDAGRVLGMDPSMVVIQLERSSCRGA